MPEIKPTCLCATAALAIVLAAAPAVAWEPNKPVEIVVAAGVPFGHSGTTNSLRVATVR